MFLLLPWTLGTSERHIHYDLFNAFFVAKGTGNKILVTIALIHIFVVAMATGKIRKSQSL
jgi:hypothetical protein